MGGVAPELCGSISETTEESHEAFTLIDICKARRRYPQAFETLPADFMRDSNVFFTPSARAARLFSVALLPPKTLTPAGQPKTL